MGSDGDGMEDVDEFRLGLCVAELGTRNWEAFYQRGLRSRRSRGGLRDHCDPFLIS